MAALTLEIANQIVFEARKYARSIDAAPKWIAVLESSGRVSEFRSFGEFWGQYT